MKEITYEEYVECLKAVHDVIKNKTGCGDRAADDHMTKYLTTYGGLYRHMIGDYTGSIEHLVTNCCGMDAKRIYLDAPIEELPLYINQVIGIEKAIILWRLKISK